MPERGQIVVPVRFLCAAKEKGAASGVGRRETAVLGMPAAPTWGMSHGEHSSKRLDSRSIRSLHRSRSDAGEGRSPPYRRGGGGQRDYYATNVALLPTLTVLLK
jgi:hypothetical protein